jgi:uncharacterized phiE125 gp8 family phage protein
MYSRVIVAPPVEPVTLAEAKLDRAIDHSLHDDLLTGLIQAAREYCENFCQRSIITQTRETSFDAFDTVLELPYGPVQEITAVEYVAGDGTVTAITDYEANIYGDVASIVASYGTLWPSTVGATLNVVTVRYIAGYAAVAGSPTDYRSNVPQSFRTAIKLLVGNWYENREASVTGTINTSLEFGLQALLFPYRMRKGMA